MLNWRRTVGKATDKQRTKGGGEAGTMAEDTLQTAASTAGGHRIGEWFWRFLSVVMLFAVCWAVWIFYQLNPTPLITRAAFEAAAKARATRDAHGLITPAAKAPLAAAPAEAPAAGTPSPATDASAAQPPKPETTAAVPMAKEPPVNVEKLKLTESIERPIPEGAAKK
jgi:hypothetical protein